MAGKHALHRLSPGLPGPLVQANAPTVANTSQLQLMPHSDEPRRSGRATKGQHTKMETPDPPTPDLKKPKAKGRASKKSAEPEPEEEPADGELIRCVCGHQSDDGGRMMVCCDNCNAWQHNDCMGVTEVEADLPDNYLCEQCDPEAHRPLLDAMARGERPWEEIAQKKARKKSGKKGKGTRPSLKSEATDADTSTPRSSVGADSNKRKHDSDDAAPQPAKARKSDATAKATRKTATAPDPMAVVKTIADLAPDARKNVAASLKKKLQPLIHSADAKGLWRIPKTRSVDSESERFAIIIEYSLFMNHCGDKPDFGGPYKQQLLRILPNIEKNEMLLSQLLNGRLTANALATMTSEEMASDEHRQRMQEMKEEVEKQSILLQDHDGPRMRRTHKGDEVIDNASNEFTSESIMSAPVVRRRESELDAQSPVDHNGSGSPTHSPAHARRESSSFNMGNVYSNSPSASQPPRPASGTHTRPPAPHFQEDPNIDNLLGDDGRDDAEYEPTDLQPTVWRGNILMASHGLSFTTSSRLVAGSDLARRIEQGSVTSLSDVFPQNLTISGRIERKRADEYLASLSQSPSTDVSVFVISPNDPADAAFEHFFSYFHGKDRFAVVDNQSTRSVVRDFYLAPLEAGSQTPQFLGRLHYNDLPPNRPRKVLLAIVVCKWPNALEGTQGTPTVLAQPNMSPAPPQLQANTPTQNGPGTASGSAYLPPPTQQNLHYQQQQQQYNMPMHQASTIPGNPYVPSQHSGPAHHQQQAQYPAWPVPGSSEAQAYEILGPFVNTPVAQHILQQGNHQAESLLGLRQLFEKYPETQHDLTRVTEVLARASQ